MDELLNSVQLAWCNYTLHNICFDTEIACLTVQQSDAAVELAKRRIHTSTIYSNGKLVTPELLDELIRIALARERRRARRSTSIETGILKNYKGGTKLRK